MEGLINLKTRNPLLLTGIGITLALALTPTTFAMQSDKVGSFIASQSRAQFDISSLLYSLRGYVGQYPTNRMLANEVSTLQTEAHDFLFVSRSLYNQPQKESTLDSTVSQLQDLNGKINFTLRAILNQNHPDSTLLNETASFASDAGALLFNLRQSINLPSNR